MVLFQCTFYYGCSSRWDTRREFAIIWMGWGEDDQNVFISKWLLKQRETEEVRREVGLWEGNPVFESFRFCKRGWIQSSGPNQGQRSPGYQPCESLSSFPSLSRMFEGFGVGKESAVGVRWSEGSATALIWRNSHKLRPWHPHPPISIEREILLTVLSAGGRGLSRSHRVKATKLHWEVMGQLLNVLLF